MTFGEFIKERRIGTGRSLRAFCKDCGYDPGNHSKIERGYMNPPDDEKFMCKLANAIGIQEGSADWLEFYSLAHVARGQIPKSLLDDEEVVAKLPVLLRTLGGERLPKAKMDELIEFIRSRQ